MVSDSARYTCASLVDTLEMKAARNKRNKASGDCRYDTHLHQPLAEAELGLSAPDTEAINGPWSGPYLRGVYWFNPRNVEKKFFFAM